MDLSFKSFGTTKHRELARSTWLNAKEPLSEIDAAIGEPGHQVMNYLADWMLNRGEGRQVADVLRSFDLT